MALSDILKKLLAKSETSAAKEAGSVEGSLLKDLSEEDLAKYNAAKNVSTEDHDAMKNIMFGSGAVGAGAAGYMSMADNNQDNSNNMDNSLPSPASQQTPSSLVEQSQAPITKPVLPEPKVEGIDLPSNYERALEALRAKQRKEAALDVNSKPIDFGANSIASREALESAQNKYNDEVAKNNAGRWGSFLGAGFSQTPVNKEALNIFEDQNKQAKSILDQYHEKVEGERDDPNSPISKGMQQMFGRLGYPIQGNASASNLEKLYPTVSKLYEKSQDRNFKIDELTLRLAQAQDARIAAKQAKLEASSTKRFDDLNKKLIEETSSSRSAFGKNALRVNQARQLETLINSAPNLDNLNARQVYEIARGLDNMLSQGAATITGSEKLMPHTLMSKIQNMKEFASNSPEGAKLGKFVAQMKDLIERERAVAQDQILATKGRVLSSYKDLEQVNPDKYNAIMEAHGIDDSTLKTARDKMKHGAGEAKQDSKVAEYAKQNNLNYNQAKQLLMNRGYKPNEQ